MSVFYLSVCLCTEPTYLSVLYLYIRAVPARPTYSAKLRLWTTLTCIGHTAVAGAGGEVVRKRIADSRTDSGYDTASACGRAVADLWSESTD